MEYSQKKIGMFFFSKNFVKIKNPLFREKFFKLFSNFSKTTQCFFLIIFGPLRRLIKTYFEKLKKKSVNFPNKKISQFFFRKRNGREKNLLFANISKINQDFSCLFSFPLSEFKVHLLEHSEIKKIEKVSNKKISKKWKIPFFHNFFTTFS